MESISSFMLPSCLGVIRDAIHQGSTSLRLDGLSECNAVATSRDNLIWGAPRIHSELLKLGIKISEASVAKYMVRYPKPPSQNWKTFLNNHVAHMASVDFFTVPTALFQV